MYYTDPSGHSCDKDANDRHPNDGQERGVPLLPAPEPILALPGPVMEPPIINPMQEMQRAQQLRELSAPEPVLALPGPVLDNYVNRTSGPDVEEPNNYDRENSNSNTKVSSRIEFVNKEEATFIIKDWSDYPDEYVPVPNRDKVWHMLEGEEYINARDEANAFNRSTRRQNSYYANNNLEIHEIEPVKFGGSPTDWSNKVAIQAQAHRRYVTPWWNKIRDEVKKERE